MPGQLILAAAQIIASIALMARPLIAVMQSQMPPQQCRPLESPAAHFAREPWPIVRPHVIQCRAIAVHLIANGALKCSCVRVRVHVPLQIACVVRRILAHRTHKLALLLVRMRLHVFGQFGRAAKHRATNGAGRLPAHRIVRHQLVHFAAVQQQIAAHGECLAANVAHVRLDAVGRVQQHVAVQRGGRGILGAAHQAQLRLVRVAPHVHA